LRSRLITGALGSASRAVESASLSRFRDDCTEGTEREVVIDPVGADNQQEDQGEKDNDAGDRDGPSFTGIAVRPERR
jgi:hypothetical protein